MICHSDIKEWVKAASFGEQIAWRVLYNYYYPQAYAIALNICGNTPEAKDAVQDSFITAYLKLGQLKDAAAFGSWIRKIVTHKCYRELNRTRLNRNYSTIPVEPDSWWEDRVNDKLGQLSTQSRLYSAITKLPEVLQTTLFLRYFSSHNSYEDMAMILAVPVGTIRSRLNQARIKLAEHWQHTNDDDERILRDNEEWNSFYFAAYSGIHGEDHYKNKFVNHLHKDIRIIVASNKINTGRNVFENLIADDRKFGSWLTPTQVQTCGNLSVVEATHYNSPEYPEHCPPTSVSVIFRSKGKISQMNLYMARK